MIGDSGILNGGVEDAVAQFVEETGDASSFVGEVIDCESFALEGVKETLANFLHALLCCLPYLAQLGGVLLEEAFLVHLLFELSAHALVFILEDGASEALDLRDDVPRLIIADVVHDILQYPLQHHVRSAQVCDELIDGHLFHLVVVEADAQVVGQVEFASHVAQHALEEGVDGLHAEVVVVIQQIRQSYAGALTDNLSFKACLLCDASQVVVGFWQLFPDAVKLAEDTHLHLLGSLVSEGDGEDVAIALRVLYYQSDIFSGERKGLSAASTRLIHCQWFSVHSIYHRLKSSKSKLMPTFSIREL